MPVVINLAQVVMRVVTGQSETWTVFCKLLQAEHQKELEALEHTRVEDIRHRQGVLEGLRRAAQLFHIQAEKLNVDTKASKGK